MSMWLVIVQPQAHSKQPSHLSRHLVAGAIVGIALAIICLLFFIQRFGTRVVGIAFSPIILLWLLCNAMIGIYNINAHGAGVFRAFGPNYWFDYLLRNGYKGWKTLGGVVLCITGMCSSACRYCRMHRLLYLASCCMEYWFM